MAGKPSKQSSGYQFHDKSALAALIQKHPDRRDITQKEPAEMSFISESRISRIMRGSTGRGNSVRITEQDINQIALALQIGRQGRDELLYAAFPERAYIEDALDRRYGIVRLNCVLDEHGLPPLDTKSK